DCGGEQGCAVAAAMAEASMLGLVAAVALPLAYAQAVRLGWRLAIALPAAVAGYITVASGLGSIPAPGALECLAISTGAILLASYLAGRIGIPRQGRGHDPKSRRWTEALRTPVPAAYVRLVGVVGAAAGPCWAGLLSTFPTMSVAVLVVTPLEAGPAEAGQIAKTLPPANLSTVAFLATFRFGYPVLGLGWGTVCGCVA